MAVKITEDMHKVFTSNGFTEDDITHTVNHYRELGQSDEEIFNNLNTKYNSLKPKTTETATTPAAQTTQNSTENMPKLEGGISQTYTQNWDKKGRVYYTDENGNKVDFKVNPIKKIGNKIKAGFTNFANWINETNPNSEAYKQKVNTILTLETMPMGAGKAATQWGASKLTPFFGKKIAGNIAEGVGAGAVGGGVFGAGNAAIEGENPVVGGITGVVGGGLSGGLLNSAIGSVARGVKARQLKKIKDTKTLRKAETDFYKDYIQQTSVNRGDLGNIGFTQAGLETVSKQPEAGRNFANLKNDIKNAKYINEELPKHPRNDNIVKFHKLEKDGQEFLIGETSDGNKYYMSKIKDGSDIQPSGVGSEPPNNIVNDISENFNPNITKSEDIKNISKKELANNKREFKQNLDELKAPKTQKTTIRMSKQGHFWSKNIDDPYTRATIDADEEFNSIIGEIKKNPDIAKDPVKTQEFEARLDKKTMDLDPDHAEEYWSKYWSAIENADEFTKVNDNFNALAGREKKTRGAVATIGRKVNQDVANTITDKTYLTRGYDVNKAQLDNMSPEELANLINGDDISDLAITARAIDINRDLENGQIPLYKLNKWAAEGTPIGRAMQARSLLKMNTPEGAIEVLAGTIRKATPKKVNDIIDSVPKLVEASEGGEAALNETLKRVNKSERKYLVDKIMDLKNKGELTNDNLVKVINKKYNVPEITNSDYENIKKITTDIENATTEREAEVAKGLLRKYIGDKIPRKFIDKVNTYRYMNMLLSPKSRVKDFLFTDFFQGEQAVDELIANALSKGITERHKGIKTRSGLHFNEWVNGLKKGLREGAEDVKLGITTGRAGEGSRFDLPKSAQFQYKPLNEVEGFKKVPQAFENVLSGLEKGLNYTIRVPDRMFYEGRYASSLADQLASQGLKEATPEIIEQAVKEAKDAVYQGDTWASKGSLAIRNALNKVPIGSFKLGDWTMPFVQTVANISEEGLKNVGGLPVGAYKYLKADTPEALRDAEILTAKGIKGLGLGAVGWGAGKGYFDTNIGDKSNYADELTGMQPQSIAVGDKSFSLANAPNLSIPIAVGRALGEKGFNREGIMQALLNAGTAVTDMPAVKSIGDLTSIVNSGYGQELTPSEIVDNVVRNQGVNYISQLIPMSGSLRNLRNIVDPYGRELYTENTPQYIANRLVNGIPFASQTLPQKYNALGEPVKVDNIQNPALRALGESVDLGIRNYNPNPTNETLNKFSDEMADSGVRGKSQIALKKSKRTININGEKVKLNNEQYSKYQRDYGRLNYILRERALKNPDFNALSNEDKTEYFSELRQSVEEAVKIVQFGHEPSKRLKPYTQEILDNYNDYIKEGD